MKARTPRVSARGARLRAGGALLAAVAVPVFACACAARTPGPHAPAPSPEPTSWVSPLDRGHPLVGRIWDVAARRFVNEAALVDALAAARFVAAGESHDNADHHILQARLLHALVARGRAPAVVFEMLDRDRQPAIDRSLAEHPRDADALGLAVEWERSGWPPWALYRPVFREATSAGLPIVAAGIDRKDAMRLATEGVAAVDRELSADPALSRPLPDAAQNAIREEMRDAHCGRLPESMLDAMVFVQRVRDAELAHRLEGAAGGHGSLLIAGNGHVRADRGVPSVLPGSAPTTRVAVGMLEVQTGKTAPDDYAALFGAARLPFDYVWFTPRASDADRCAEIRAH